MKPLLLLVDDDEATVFGFSEYLSKAGYAVDTASTIADAESRILLKKFDAVLLDMKLPDGNGIDLISMARKKSPETAIIIITGHGDIAIAVEAMQLGADHFFTKPVHLQELDEFMKKKIEFEKLRRKDEAYRRTAHRIEPYFGSSTAIKKVFDLASMAANNDSVVMLQGKTGTGKGLLARWIHERSARATEPFVEVNCAGLRGELLCSELFGHVKGAFTSSVSDKQGLIEVANRGTLFLDEIGDMDAGTQALFLKAIEEKTYRRVGESQERTSDFRLICATNCNLTEQVEKGLFRSDLYYRICVFPIEVPGLQERKEDLPGLVEHILTSLNAHPMEISAETIEFLKQYEWPGNVRELKNMLERALILSQGQAIAISHFPGLAAGNSRVFSPSRVEDLEVREQQHIRDVLAKCNGDTIKASKALGISRASLYRKLNKAKQFSEKGAL